MTGSNVLGEPLEPCSFAPLTGFWRDGHCRTGGEDIGVHGVCAVMTDEFLACTASLGVVVAGDFGVRGVWAALAVLIVVRAATMGARFARRRWLVTGWA